MGPARMGIPVLHAASAPALGSLERRGAALVALALTGAAIRFAYYIATSAFYVLVLVGLDAYAGTYEAIRETLTFLPSGDAAPLVMTTAFLLVWSLVAGLIQAWVLRTRPSPLARRRRRVRRAACTGAGALGPGRPARGRRHGPRRDRDHARHDAARRAALVAAWLLAAWLIVRAGARSLTGGLALAALLALSTLAFGFVGGLGAELALRRASRVALLVLTAVWLRSAAGAEGLRAISAARRAPASAPAHARLAARVLGASAGVGNYGESARALGRRLAAVRKRPGPLLGAVLAWIADEAQRVPRAGDEAAARWSPTEAALVVAAGGLATLALASTTVWAAS